MVTGKEHLEILLKAINSNFRNRTKLESIVQSYLIGEFPIEFFFKITGQN